MIVSVVCLAAVAAMLGQAALFASLLRRMQEAHVRERSHMVAAILARTPGEYAGLVAAANIGGRERPAKPRQKPKDSDEIELDAHPIGL